jgi:hypothetical protein
MSWRPVIVLNVVTLSAIVLVVVLLNVLMLSVIVLVVAMLILMVLVSCPGMLSNFKTAQQKRVAKPYA